MIIQFACFPFDEIPRFSCPRCGKGQLRILKETIIKKHPAWIKTLPTMGSNISYDGHGNEISLLCQEDVIGNPNEEFIASFFLECDVEKCGEVVVASGSLKCVEYDSNNEFSDDFFYPISFHPTVHLFDIPQRTPEKVKNELINSFSLFWISPSACANAVRISIEKLMDELGITGGSLHNRIKEFSRKKPENVEKAEILLAVKWIGNDGSHEGGLMHSDLFTVYDFVENVLKELYDISDADRLRLAMEDRVRLVKEVNNSQKPPSKFNVTP